MCLFSCRLRNQFRICQSANVLENTGNEAVISKQCYWQSECGSVSYDWWWCLLTIKTSVTCSFRKLILSMKNFNSFKIYCREVIPHCYIDIVYRKVNFSRQTCTYITLKLKPSKVPWPLSKFVYFLCFGWEPRLCTTNWIWRNLTFRLSCRKPSSGVECNESQ